MQARRAAALAAALAMVGCNASKPSEPTLPPPQRISGSLSLPSGCQAAATATPHPGEPSLAVDPGNADRLVAAWLDNRSPDAVGIVVAISNDGGKRWSRSAFAPLLSCSGGPYTHATDPWISIGPDGLIYLSTLVRKATAEARTPYDIVVGVSRDHGTTWETPVVIESAMVPPTQPDKEAVLADRRHPGTAYVVWVDYPVAAGAEPSVDRIMFARTADGGRSWSSPRQLYSGNDEAQENQLLMTAGGVLLDLFVEGSSLPGTANPPPLPVKMRVMRSTDQGQSWSAPIDAADFTYTTAVDPGTGKMLRVTGQNIVGAVAGNALYAAWFETHQDFSSILLSRSDDGGLHWRSPRVVVRERPQAFLPTLAVTGNGTLGMLWFDQRHYTKGSSRLDTDVWFSTSKDQGAHWKHVHAAGPFDLRAAPQTRYGPFIGDYMGLVGLPHAFGAVFVMPRAQTTRAETEVYFSRIAA